MIELIIIIVLIKHPLKKGNLDKDSSLAGFIDADGSFYIKHIKLENNAKKRNTFL